MYADDVAFYTSSHSIREIYSTLVIALDSMCVELEVPGFGLSCIKSKLCILSKNKHRKIDFFIARHRFRLLHAGIEAPRVKKVRFLGVVLDSGLKWRAHFVDVASKCRKRFNVLKSIAGIFWCSHPSTLLRIYKVDKISFGILLSGFCRGGSFILYHYR